MIHTVKDFSIINETDVFLEFLFFLYDAFNVSNLNSDFSAFSKPSLYIWKFSIQVLLKPSWKDFGHNLTSMGSELNCPVVWTFFSAALLGNWMNTDLFQSCGHFWVFQICWHVECSTLIASSFRILNSLLSDCCCYSVKPCPALCDSMDCSMPGLSAPLHLLEFTQTHVHQVSDEHHVHPAISSCDALFSFCPQSFPASGTFPMSQLFASDDHNTEASASASVLPMSI